MNLRRPRPHAPFPRSVLLGAVLALSLVLAVPSPAMADDAATSVRVLSPGVRDASFLGAPPGISLILVEGSTGQVIASRDAERRRPIASAIKLVTALAVVEALPAGTLVVIGEEVRGIEGSSYGLRVGEIRSVEDLLVGLLLRSGNDAAVALAHAASGTEAAFVLRMQAKLLQLGIDVVPGSASGLDEADALSAEELAKVARAALAEPRIAAIVGVSEFEVDAANRIENRNLFVGQFSGATGLKTGYTSAAGYTLAASARRDGRELVATVLGAPDDIVRRTLAARLLEYGFEETRLSSVAESVTLRTSRGPVRFSTDGVSATLVSGVEVRAAWPATMRPDDAQVEVEIHIDGRPAGSASTVRRDARTEVGPATIGGALADGIYAALRPIVLAGGMSGEAPGGLR